MSRTSPEPVPFSPEEAALLLRAAHLAPSIHNSQPWHFTVRADRVEVFADPTRSLPAVDPDGRQADGRGQPRQGRVEGQGRDLGPGSRTGVRG